MWCIKQYLAPKLIDKRVTLPCEYSKFVSVTAAVCEFNWFFPWDVSLERELLAGGEGLIMCALDESVYDGVGERVAWAFSHWRIAVVMTCNSKEIMFFFSNTLTKNISKRFSSTFSKWRRDANFAPFKIVLDPSISKPAISRDPGRNSKMSKP